MFPWCWNEKFIRQSFNDDELDSEVESEEIFHSFLDANVVTNGVIEDKFWKGSLGMWNASRFIFLILF